MDDEALRDALLEAGLSQYQADAYLAVLDLGKASAARIAERSSVPQSRVYDVLRELESMDYVETFEQDSLHARPSGSDAVLEELRGQATLLSTAVDEIDERRERPAVDDHVASIVKVPGTVESHARAGVAEAELEVLVSASPDQFRDLRPALREAYDRGAVVDVVISTPDRGALPPSEAFEGCATEVRYRDIPGPFLVHTERQQVYFWPYEHSDTQYGLIVDDHSLSYLFYWYFQTCLWEQWETVHSTRGDPPVEYADFRRCAGDVRALLSEGREVAVTVRGRRTDDGAPVTITGAAVDVSYGSVTREGVTPESVGRYAGPTTLYVEADGRTYSVGGWGAFREDVEADQIILERVGSAGG